MKSFARYAFGFLVRLHPPEFQHEFGVEMLWIFNESIAGLKPGTSSLDICTYLLFDVFRSALLQWFLRKQKQIDADGTMFVQVDSFGMISRAGQITFLVLACLCTAFNIVLFMYMVKPGL